MQAFTHAPGRALGAVQRSIMNATMEFGQIVIFIWKTLTLLPKTIRNYRKQTWKTMNDMAWGSGSLVVDGGVISLMFFLGTAVGAVVAIQAFMAFDLLGFGALTGIIGSGGLSDDGRDRRHADLGRDRRHRGDGPAGYSVRGGDEIDRRNAGRAPWLSDGNRRQLHNGRADHQAVP
jgi:hypothetical protein